MRRSLAFSLLCLCACGDEMTSSDATTGVASGSGVGGSGAGGPTGSGAGGASSASAGAGGEAGGGGEGGGSTRDAILFAGRSGGVGTTVELWKTDGTSAGTVKVADLDPTGSATPGGFTALAGGTVVFTASDGVSGVELWRSDGTEAGTGMVLDIHPAGSSMPQGGVVLDGKYYFWADDGAHGRELWVSDGTSAGTSLVVDLRPSGDAQGLSPLAAPIVVLDGRLYFNANDGANGEELWTSDGTMAGTTLVRDIAPGALGSYVQSPCVAGGELYFGAAGVDGNELWKSDGTPAGTVQVKDISPGPGGSGPRPRAEVDGKLFLVALTPSAGSEPWLSDGTEGGTLGLDLWPGLGSGTDSAGQPVASGGKLYFYASDGDTSHGLEPWISDGTVAGTVMLKDVNPGPDASSPLMFAPAGDLVLFPALDPIHDNELWRTDGTTAGTVLVKDINPTGPSFPRFRGQLPGRVLFVAIDGAGSDEPWISDGTAAGTFQLADICPGPCPGML